MSALPTICPGLRSRLLSSASLVPSASAWMPSDRRATGVSYAGLSALSWISVICSFAALTRRSTWSEAAERRVMRYASATASAPAAACLAESALKWIVRINESSGLSTVVDSLTCSASIEWTRSRSAAAWATFCEVTSPFSVGMLIELGAVDRGAERIGVHRVDRHRRGRGVARRDREGRQDAEDQAKDREHGDDRPVAFEAARDVGELHRLGSGCHLDFLEVRVPGRGPAEGFRGPPGRMAQQERAAIYAEYDVRRRQKVDES